MDAPTPEPLDLPFPPRSFAHFSWPPFPHRCTWHGRCRNVTRDAPPSGCVTASVILLATPGPWRGGLVGGLFLVSVGIILLLSPCTPPSMLTSLLVFTLSCSSCLWDLGDCANSTAQPVKVGLNGCLLVGFLVCCYCSTRCSCNTPTWRMQSFPHSLFSAPSDCRIFTHSTKITATGRATQQRSAATRAALTTGLVTGYTYICILLSLLSLSMSC